LPRFGGCHLFFQQEKGLGRPHEGAGEIHAANPVFIVCHKVVEYAALLFSVEEKGDSHQIWVS